MPSRSVRLFGPPQVTFNGGPVHVTRKKALAIVAYVLLNDLPVSRERLCGLCWPHLDPHRARGSLRTTLAHVREVLSSDVLVTDREHVAANGNALFVDVREFLSTANHLNERSAHGPELETREIDQIGRAAELYRGEFMAGFFLSGCPRFDEWQMEMTDYLRRVERDLLWALARHHGEAGDVDRAVEALRKLLALDPLEEAAHRELMVLFHEHGDRTAARRQYERCASLMQSELGRPPEEATSELLDEIERAAPVMRDPIASARALLPRHEIRYATILIAGRDPSETVRGMLSGIVSRFEATVHAGVDDTTVAFFGTSRTHEDDPVRATIAAIELRAALTRRGIRVAQSIRTGPLLVATDHHEPPVGPLLNLSYRQLFHTKTGDVAICRQTFRRVHTQIDCEPASLGGEEAQRLGQLWRATSRRPGGAILAERSIPFAGRTAELRSLERALGAAGADEHAAVIVEGEPGIGKSRIVIEARERLLTVRPELIWLTLSCFERLGQTAYECLRPLLRTLVSTATRMGCGDSPEAIVSSMVSAGSVDFARAGSVVEAIRTLDGDDSSAPVSQTDRSLRVDQFHAACESAFTGLLKLMLERDPVVLHVEDLHWADPATATLLVAIAGACRERGLRLVVSYRPSELGRIAFAAHTIAETFNDHAITLSLEGLSQDTLAEIVRFGREGSTVDERTVTAIARRSDGNPFFALELARSGFLPGTDQSAFVPVDIARVIQRRADTLAPDARTALRTSAVAGDEVRWSIVVHACGLTSTADTILDELVDTGFLRRLAVYPHTVVGFAHVLFSDAVYASIPLDESVRLHGQVARSIEDDPPGESDEAVRLLAFHHDRAGNHEPAARYLIERGNQLRGLFDFGAAIAAYSAAISHLREGGTTRQLRECWLRIASCHEQRLDHDAAQDAFREAFELVAERSAPPPPSSHDRPGEGIHRFFLQRAPISLDPLETPNLIAFVIHRQIYRPLVRYTFEQMVEPDAASEWESSADGLSYRFVIRDDAWWSDGAPLISEDYVQAIRRSITMSQIDWGYQTIPIAGRERFLETGEPTTLAIRTPEPRVLEFDLDAPAPFLLHLLGVPYMGALPSHRMQDLGSAWSDPNHSVSSGPFRIDRFEPNRGVYMVRNERYTGRFTGNIREADYLLGDNDDLLPGFVRNEFDTAVLSQEDLPEAYRLASECVFTGPALATVGLMVNPRSPSMRFRELRQALVHAIDRNEIVRTVLGGYQFPACGGIVPPGVFGHRDDAGLAFDPALAAQLASAWPKDHERRIRIAANPFFEPLTQALAASWRRTLSIEIDVTAWPGHASLHDVIASQTCDLAMVFARALVADPICYLQLALAIDDESVREQIVDVELIPEFRERIAMTRELDSQLVQNALFIPLYYPRGYILSKPWVENFVVMPFYHGGGLDAVVRPHPMGPDAVDP